MEELLYHVLDAALALVHASPGPAAVSSILASSASDDEQATLEGLTAAQIVRAYLHSAAASKQAQAVLLDIQSIAALYPATVPLVLHAMDSQQRCQLQSALLDLAQQQQCLLQLESQQQGHLAAPDDTAAAGVVQVQPWVLQLDCLGVWDVVLLLGLLGDQKWEADASIILLDGVKDMTSLQQVSDLFRDLSAVCDGAADWLLGVGLKWVTTCYIDMLIDGSSLEQAGTSLLKAGIWATAQLAKQGMQQVLQQLMADSSGNSALWQVLQHIVAKCICVFQQQQATEQQQQRPCSQDALTGGSNGADVTGSQDVAIASVCVQQLVAQLTPAVLLSCETAALQYIMLIQPLASVSCVVMHALVDAAESLLRPETRPGQQRWLEQHHIKQQQLVIKQEVQEANALRGDTAEAAAAVAALAIGRAGASLSAAVSGSAASDAAALGSNHSNTSQRLHLEAQHCSEQQQQRHQNSSRYSWGFGDAQGHYSSVDEAVAGSSRHWQQQTPSLTMLDATPTFITGATTTQEKTAAAAGPVSEATPGPAAAVQPLLSPAASPSHLLRGVHSQPATPPAPAAATTVSASASAALQPQQQGQQPELRDFAAVSKGLNRLLCRAAAFGTTGSRSNRASGLHDVESAVDTSSPVRHCGADLPPTEQLVAALLCAVLRQGAPCDSEHCQQQLTVAMQQTMMQLTPAAIQHISGQCRQNAGDKLHSLSQQPQQQQATPADNNALAAAATSADFNTQTLHRGPVPARGGEAELPMTSSITASGGCGVYGSMRGCWWKTLLHLLQQQIEQLQLSPVSPGLSFNSSSSECKGNVVSDQLAALPCVLQLVLDSLSTGTPIEGLQATSHKQQQQQQQRQQDCDSQQPAAATTNLAVASLLGQLLQKLLQSQPQQHTAAAAAPDSGVVSCAEAVRELLVRCHALSLLMPWMLQQPAAATQVIAAAAALGLVINTDAAQAEATVGVPAAAAAAGTAAPDDAVLEIDDMHTATETAAEPQRQQQNNAAAEGLPPAAAVNDAFQLVDIISCMALKLHQLQVVMLPDALQQLLAAHEASSICSQQQQTSAGEVTPGPDASGSSSQQQAVVSKLKRASCPFFVVHTAAEKTAATDADSRQQHHHHHQQQQADLHMPASATGASLNKCRQVQLLPADLLQLPVLPLAVCHHLLQTADHKLSTALVQLHSQQQQQLPSRRSSMLGPAGASIRASNTRGRRNSSAAAGAASQLAALSPDQVHGLGCSPNSSNDSVLVAVAAALQRVRGLMEVSLMSVLTWVDEQSGEDGGGCKATAAPHAASAAAAAYRCAVVLLHLHNQLLAVSHTPCVSQQQLRLPSMMPQPLQQQQVAGVACTALSLAAQLLEHWWAAAPAAPAPSSSDVSIQQQQQRLLLKEPLKHLETSLVAMSPGCSHPSAAGVAVSHDGGVSAGSLCWSDVAAVFGHGLGSNSWTAMKRLQQQEQLLAVLLELLIKIHHLANNQGQPAAAAAVSSNCQPSIACIQMACLLQQLAVLSAIAEETYSSAAAATVAAAGGGAVGGARWLMKLLVSKSQQLVLGQLLSPALICSVNSVSALVKLTRPSNLKTPAQHQAPEPQRSNTPDRSPALLAHLLCMHHSPRVYAAAESSIWGRQGLAVGPGAGPGWVVGCSRGVAVAAARALVQQVTLELQRSSGRHVLGSGAAGASGQQVPDAAATGAAGMPAGWDLPPTRQCVRVWQSYAAAVAAVCDCCELLLSHQALQARHRHQQQQVNSSSKATSKAASSARRHGGDSSSADGEQDGAADLRLVVRGLAAALGGPCSAAAAHMAALLRWRLQQQQQQQIPEAEAVEQAGRRTTSSLGLLAAAGTAIDAVEPKQLSKSRKGSARKQQKKAGASAAADPDLLVQTQLSLLLGLGCAAGKLVLTRRGQLLQAQQGQQQQRGQRREIGYKVAMQQLLQELRAFSSAYQQLLQAVRQATAAGGGGHSSASGETVAQAFSSSLETHTQKCAVQSRKDAWAAVAAAAAVLEDSSSEEDDSDLEVEQACGDAGLDRQLQQHGTGHQRHPLGAAAADPASRFYDAEVHEELPYSDDDVAASDSDGEGGAAAVKQGEDKPLFSSDRQQDDQQEAVDGSKHKAGHRSVQSRRGPHQVLKQKHAGTAHVADHRQQQQLQSAKTVPNDAPASGTAAAAITAARAAAAAKAAAARARGNLQQRHIDPRLIAATPPAAAAQAREGAETAAMQTPAKSGPAAKGHPVQHQRSSQAAAGPNVMPSTVNKGRERSQRQPITTQQELTAASAITAAASPGTGSVEALGCTPRGRGGPKRYPVASLQTKQQSATPAVAAEAAALVAAVAPGPVTKGDRSALQVSAAAEQPLSAANPQQQQAVPVVCGDQHGSFDINSQQVTLPNGTVITPTAFERLGGKASFKKWKNSVHVIGDDGQQGVKLAHWLNTVGSAATAGVDAAAASLGKHDQRLPKLQAGKKRKQSQANVADPGSAEEALAAALGDPSDSAHVIKKAKRSTAVESVGNIKACAKNALAGAPQQTKKTGWEVPVGVDPPDTHAQQQQQQGGSIRPGQQNRAGHKQQKQRAHLVTVGADAKNAFVEACLAEAKGAAYSTDEESEDDSDYSDLEDFIVVQPGKDYSRVCAEAGGRLSWKRKWLQVPGGLRGEQG